MPFDAFMKFTQDLLGGSDSDTSNRTVSSSGRGAGRAALKRTPMQNAPIGQAMALGGVKGYKHADGTWKEGTPDAATIDAQPKGMIDVHLPNSTAAYAYGGFAKSLAGPLGQPFNLIKPQAQVEFEDKTKAIVPRQADGSIVFNRPVTELAGTVDQYNELGKDLGNKVLGRYSTSKTAGGSDVSTDQFDTNEGVDYHATGLLTGFTPPNEKGERIAVDRGISAAAGLHRALDNIGWTNSTPYGNLQVVGTPGKDISSLDDVFDALDSSSSKPEAPASSGSYTISAGDTLSSIAAANNTTVEELARKNNINDINMINAGSILDL